MQQATAGGILQGINIQQFKLAAVGQHAIREGWQRLQVHGRGNC